MTSLALPESAVLPLEEIKPYEKNPRTIPERAIEAVRESIERYGYRQPIVVDRNHVIIVGHTRLLALRRLGWTEATVFVADLPESKAREYRLIDNRTSETGQWDHAALIVELREFEEELLERFFPSVDLEVSSLKDAVVTTKDVEDAVAKTLEEARRSAVPTTSVRCPSCYDLFSVRTDTLPGLSRMDLAALEPNE